MNKDTQVIITPLDKNYSKKKGEIINWNYSSDWALVLIDNEKTYVRKDTISKE